MLLDVKFHRQAINLKEDLNFRVVCGPDMRLFCKFVIHTCDCLNCVFNCFSLLWIFDCFAGKHRGRIFKCTNSACIRTCKPPSNMVSASRHAQRGRPSGSKKLLTICGRSRTLLVSTLINAQNPGHSQ